ncbi:MAG: hypothetical protein U1D30_05100 [Planctomycetota bacterium]
MSTSGFNPSIASTVLTEHRIRVLLVDDQAIIAEALRRMLQDQPDIDFQVCREATKAIAVANEFPPP